MGATQLPNEQPQRSRFGDGEYGISTKVLRRFLPDLAADEEKRVWFLLVASEWTSLLAPGHAGEMTAPKFLWVGAVSRDGLVVGCGFDVRREAGIVTKGKRVRIGWMPIDVDQLTAEDEGIYYAPHLQGQP